MEGEGGVGPATPFFPLSPGSQRARHLVALLVLSASIVGLNGTPVHAVEVLLCRDTEQCSIVCRNKRGQVLFQEDNLKQIDILENERQTVLFTREDDTIEMRDFGTLYDHCEFKGLRQLRKR